MISSISKTLRDKYEGPHERVGFILENDEVVEVLNRAPEPEDTFDVSAEDLLTYCDQAKATWHTHPEGGSNLSVGDRESFLLWPDLLHYIVGKDDITCYRVEGGAVLKHEA